MLDRLDTPALVANDLGEVLAHNPLAVALLGDEARFGRGRPQPSRWYRWFTDRAERDLHAVEDHDRLPRTYAAALRTAVGSSSATPWWRRATARCSSSTRPHLAPTAQRLRLLSQIGTQRFTDDAAASSERA